MSARDSLIGAAYCGFDPERFDPLKAAVAAVDAYRAEVLREARKEIVAASLATPDLKARELWKSGYKAGLSMAAVICTPDTP